MSASKRTEERLKIKLEAEWAELKLKQSVFNFILDKHGLPHFPESMKKELPPYMLLVREGSSSRLASDFLRQACVAVHRQLVSA